MLLYLILERTLFRACGRKEQRQRPVVACEYCLNLKKKKVKLYFNHTFKAILIKSNLILICLCFLVNQLLKRSANHVSTFEWILSVGPFSLDQSASSARGPIVSSPPWCMLLTFLKRADLLDSVLLAFTDRLHLRNSKISMNQFSHYIWEGLTALCLSDSVLSFVPANSSALSLSPILCWLLTPSSISSPINTLVGIILWMNSICKLIRAYDCSSHPY